MTNSGNDCYFFYYSTCSKGDSCPFRHCEAAMGSEMVCNLWQEGRCFRTVCKFRHMEITKNRKEIQCYWENQPAGCQKPHCAFFHEKPRYIEDVFVPPNKSVNKPEVQQHEEPEPPVPASVPTAANPQLRGVIKTDNQELVPSPTHPPVVINPADDDEDEDDQFSEEGEDGKGGPSPRKQPKSNESLNFGVSTLEEIRLRKALKASMKRAGYPLQSAESPANGEKENIQSLFRPAVFETRGVPSLVNEETGRTRGRVAERLGRKIPIADTNRVEGLPLKRSLAARLGRVVDVEHLSEPPQKTFKPVKDRLGLLSGSAACTQQDDPVEVSKKVPGQIRIKTLEEIKQEKASKTQSQNDASLLTTPENSNSKTGSVKNPKDTQVGVKTFSEILQAKKRKQEQDEEQRQNKAVQPVEKAPGRSQEALNTPGPQPKATNVGGLRVKTLEEIRREKAARMQAQPSTEAEDKKSCDAEDSAAKKPRLLRIKKLPVKSNDTSEKSAEVSVKPVRCAAASPEMRTIIKVKSLEEIKREKQLRKQELEEKHTNATEAEPPQNQAAAAAAAASSLRRKRPVKISLTPPGAASPPTASGPEHTLSTQKVPTHKTVPLKSKNASQWKSRSVPDTAAAAEGADALAPVKQLPDTEPQSRNTRNSSALSPAKHARGAAQCPAGESPAAETPLSTHQKESPQHTADTKVRPKLNVKPSVMKPAVQMKPGLKRKRAQQSAVAAVKPLTSTSTMQEETQQEAACKETPVLPPLSTEAQLSSAVPCSPTNQLDSGSTSSPLREELQTVPVFKQSPSLAMRTPTQPKSRRGSVAASRSAPAPSTAPASSSAEDDFDDLINEFTDDHLEDDMDPAIGEDDLLQELSEMIDS